jgi:hypothetical protein
LDRRCAASVSIDGKNVGLFRIAQGDRLVLEHLTNDNGRFTFYASRTPESNKSCGNSINRNDKCLIVLTFKPVKVKIYTGDELQVEPPYTPKPWKPYRALDYDPTKILNNMDLQVIINYPRHHAAQPMLIWVKLNLWLLEPIIAELRVLVGTVVNSLEEWVISTMMKMLS